MSVEEPECEAVVALFFILVYIGLRFNMRYAPGAVVALSRCHDHPGDFRCLRITLTILAALLTIVGYSLNDTIVVFDQFEKIPERLRQSLPTIVNQA